MPDLGTRWGAPALALLLTALLLLGAGGAPPADGPDRSRYVLQIGEGALDRVEALVTDGGGTVRARLDGLSSLVIDAGPVLVASLRDAPEVVRVTADGEVRLHGFAPNEDAGSLYTTSRHVVRATEVWALGHYGEGVDVALIDSGTVPVEGLDGPGKVVHGPDLSFESQDPETRHLDTFGHGTHLAGIIAGRDADATLEAATGGSKSGEHYVGIAPGARLVSVKVADNAGTTDVSQVIAAIDWVIQHRTSGDLDVRVLNLAFGTDSTQPYLLDPLAHAAEVAWRRGIVVVAAAGNDGAASTSLDDPAYSPHILAVGATGPTEGGKKRGDHVWASYSSCGDGVRDPDVLAPGTSIVSLRSPGSRADVEHGATGYVSERYFRGTGTSQATAVVSGAAALLLSARPDLTPDQVKQALVSTADAVPGDARCVGAGLIDVGAALAAAGGATAPVPAAAVSAPAFSTGLGTLEAARGGLHLVDRVCTGELEHDDGELECDDGDWVRVELSGEQDIFGAPWSGSRWSADLWAGSTWSGGDWNGSRWSGSTWSGSRWSAGEWTGSRWSGGGWSDLQWSGSRWSGSRWSGSRWSGSRWSATFWTTGGWSATGWSTSDWR